VDKKELEIVDDFTLRDLILTALELDQEASENKEMLQAIKDRLGTKVNGYIFKIKEYHGCLENIDDEIKYLKKKKELYQKGIDWLRDTALEMMEIQGVDRLLSASGRKMIKMQSDSVDIINPSIIPKKYIKTKITQDIDKATIKEELKAGRAVVGARLVSKDWVKIT